MSYNSGNSSKNVTGAEIVDGSIDFEDIGTLTGNLSLGDSVKAKFGASDDLQIYHDGNHSYISEVGTGNLRLNAQNFTVRNHLNNESMIIATPDSGVYLYYDNSSKLATTSAGINVIGSVTCDGIESHASSSARVTLANFENDTNAGGTEAAISLTNNTPVCSVNLVSHRVGANAGSDFYIENANSASGFQQTFRAAENGDISFYEDTGTTPKFFWDASTERLGIGTSSPNQLLEIKSGSAYNSTIRLQTSLHRWDIQGGESGYSSTVFAIDYDGVTSFRANGATDNRFNGGLSVGSINTAPPTNGLYVLGNVGIGTSSPSFVLDVKGSASTQLLTRIDNDSTAANSGAGIQFDSSVATGVQTAKIYTSCPSNNNVNLIFQQEINGVNGTVETMRIDSSGNVLVGTTSSTPATGTTAGIALRSDGKLDASVDGATHRLNRLTSDGQILQFRKDGTTVGNITVSGSSTAYNTSSDYRLKENVVPMTGSIDRLKQLKPSRFNFIADADTTVDGFLAHEAGEVVPECVSGEKDAMRTEEYEVTPAVMDGDTVVTEAVMGEREVPDYQGIDQSKLVPLLVASLQEAVARIEVLESQLGA